jgi:hypothetical protein
MKNLLQPKELHKDKMLQRNCIMINIDMAFMGSPNARKVQQNKINHRLTKAPGYLYCKSFVLATHLDM